MKFKYIKGTEKDFEGAPEWVTMKQSNGRFYGIHHFNLYYIDCDSGKKQLSLFNTINHLVSFIGRSEIIAQREPITESQSWFEKGELPPVGEKVECHMVNWYDTDKWIETSLICAHDDKIWIDGSDSIFLTNNVMFRPLKTKEQKQKEELRDDLASLKLTDFDVPVGILSSKLYDMGWRKVEGEKK